MGHIGAARAVGQTRFSLIDGLIDYIAPAPWSASVGATSRRAASAPLYPAEERRRRDRSPWTIVQAVLAPVQFLVFLASLTLVLRYLTQGADHDLASMSVMVKTGVLYTIMITGAVWEKDVFGKWLFAPAFFWEDVVSMAVIALHTAYVAAATLHFGSQHDQMIVALAAYASYVVNAAQFVWKFRMARLETHDRPSSSSLSTGAA